MSLIEDTEHATECLDHLQTMLWEGGDHSQDDEITSLICMLQSPLFRQLLGLQDSLQELEQVNQSKGLEECDFELLPELHIEEGHVNPVFKPESPVLPKTSNTYKTTPGYDEELQRVIESAAEGREVEVIKLFKPEKQSLGFSVVANQGESGIFVQDIQPGGIADRQGGLRERDQILAIDGQPLDISYQEAIKILQSAGGLVELVVARGPLPQGPGEQLPGQDTSQTVVENPEMVLNTEWTQIEVIDLMNDGTGLGFGIIGGRSTGVVVKTILPGGVADADGRLHSGDHILEIGEVNVRGMGSEQVAAVLRQSGSHVRLIVARPIIEPSTIPSPNAPIVPTHELDQHLQQIHSLLEKQEILLEKGLVEQQPPLMRQQGFQEQVQVHPPPYSEDIAPEFPEVEYFSVNLAKDAHQGLGITIAGYVGRENTPDDLCGIFVKSITEGSAASMNGQIQVNDQIIEVDGQPLQGYSNHDAVEVLRNTGQVVNLKLARYQHGAKFEKLQQYLGGESGGGCGEGVVYLTSLGCPADIGLQSAAQPQLNGQPTLPPPTSSFGPPVYNLGIQQNQMQQQQASMDMDEVGVGSPVYNLGMQQDQVQQQAPIDVDDVALYPQDDMDGDISPEVEVAIKACWEPIIGDEFEVVVAQLSKFREGGGLGISLEGTVDVENGVEVRPHHYIRAILPDGPVGVNGRLLSGDELLEVNGKRLLGLNHKEVVGILKELPQNVRLVCARRKHTAKENYAQEGEFSTPPLNTGVIENVPERLVKSKSDQSLPTEPPAQSNLLNKKSRSLEPLTGLAMWSSEPVIIELRKGDKGLGFSILDYQDPVNPSETVIVIRSLVPGGVAQLDGRLVPGDRLIFVNDVNLENATLDEAVQALKGAPKGVVKIGVAKPLPFSGAPHQEPLEPAEPLQDTQQIEASVSSQQFGSPHEHANDGQFVASTEPLAVSSNVILPTQLRRNESSSSESSIDEMEEDDRKGIGRRDSFYESDEDLSFVTPTKSDSGKKTKAAKRPVPVPRKQDSMASATSYENEEAIATFKAQETLEKKLREEQYAIAMAAIAKQQEFELEQKKNMLDLEDKSNEPQQLDTSTSFNDYENAPMSVTDVKSSYSEETQRQPSPELYDYENSNLEQLPTYEEAISGDIESHRQGHEEDAEFFNLDDLEAPPVPMREDSHKMMSGSPTMEFVTNNTLSDVSSEELASQQTPKTSPEKDKGVRRSGARPPVPPKPVLSPSGSVGKDEPPPLPISSPPPMTVHEAEVKSKSIPSEDDHQKTDSIDSTSSSDHFTTSDLKVVPSPKSPSASPRTASPHAASPRTESPGRSPISSPSLMRSFSGPDAFPPQLERRIVLKRSQNNLGIGVEASEKGTNGCIVKTLTKSGAIYKDGNIQVGDYIMSINNESMRRITNTQARVILRRASLMGSADISITYVTAADAAAYKESVANRPPESPSTPTMMPSPNSTLSPRTGRASVTSDGSASSTPSSPAKSVSPMATSPPPQSPPPHTIPPQASPRRTTKSDEVNLANQTWGPPRLVELQREPGKTLGISIVGGRVDMFNVAEEHVISGIFIKHVLEESPAGRNGTLKTGDRILQVDGKDLRNATHDQAVEIIRNASNPVRFVVQSLGDPACPRDLETDTKSVHSYDEALLQMQPIAPVTSQNQVVETPIQTSSPVPPVSTEPKEETEEDDYGYTLERIQRRYGELNGELLLVELKRGSTGLGISLAGNKDRNTMSVFVAGIQPDSTAAQDGQIQIGDELLEVNGNVLYGRSHLNASAIIKGLNTSDVKFVLLRREDNLERMAVKPIKMTSPIHPKEPERGDSAQSHSPPHSEPATISPTPSEEKAALSSLTSIHDVIQVINLQKGPSGLGFAIVEEAREGRQGIYVRSITVGGVADKDGQLSVGDQILEVQDKNLTDVHYEKAIEILRNSQGSVRLKVRKCHLENVPDNIPPGQGQISLANTPGESSTDAVDSSANQVSEEGSHDPLTCPIVPGQETAILIEKGRTGLGLSIVGGADTLLGAIIIHEVYEDGAAARDRRLWAGDQILEVNGENLREATHDYAIQVLRQTPATVRMLVFRDDSHVKEEDIYDIFTVDLIKKPGKGLGLSIVGKRNDVGVYISDIVKGGASEADGRLMQGDQILAVNGEDMRNATQEYAAAVLKTLMWKVTLTVGRLKAGSRTSSRRNSNSPGHPLRKTESTASNKSRGGRHSKKSSEDLSHIRTVELQHDASGSLGLSIAGGVGSTLGDTPVVVANMTSNGPAEKSRKLKVGDKILSINGVNTEGLQHSQVIQMLKSAEDSVTLQVTQGEQTQVSVSGRTSVTKSVSSDHQPDVQISTPQENNVFDPEDDGPPPQCKSIVLERGPDGLGFSIVGGHGSPHGDLPIYVKNVFSKGAAAENGQLKRGDQILSVNGQSLEGLNHEEAVNILKNAKGSVTMSVLS